MKRYNVINLWAIFNRFENEKYNILFSYFIAKNKIKLKDEILLIEQAKQPSDEYLEFDKQRVDLALKYCDRDENEKPKIFEKNYVITENKKEFDEELIKLRDSFSNVINEREQQMQDYIDFLNKDVDIELESVSLEHLPPNIEPKILEVFMESNIIK